MPEEIAQFLKANKETEAYEVWIVALNTGMRKAELAGLCWDKVDFNNGLIHVSRCRDRFGLRDSTKTQGSFRYIPMNDACMEALIKLKKESRHEKLVFAYFDGRPIDFVHIAEREFNKPIKVSGVKRIRFHDLRGTFAANICMAPDGDLYALSKILGHTNVDMTVKKYAHLHNNFLKKVSNSVNFKTD